MAWDRVAGVTGALLLTHRRRRRATITINTLKLNSKMAIRRELTEIIEEEEEEAKHSWTTLKCSGLAWLLRLPFVSVYSHHIHCLCAHLQASIEQKEEKKNVIWIIYIVRAPHEKMGELNTFCLVE